MKVKSESEVAQSCPTLRDSMDCSPPGSSVHGIFQARVLEWVAIAFSRAKTEPQYILTFDVETQECKPTNDSWRKQPERFKETQSAPKFWNLNSSLKFKTKRLFFNRRNIQQVLKAAEKLNR